MMNKDMLVSFIIQSNVDAKAKNILLPVDGSQQSIDSFKQGMRITRQWDSNVYLVRVVKEDDGQDIPKEQRE